MVEFLALLFFPVALALMIVCAHYVLEGGRIIGLAAGISPFVTGLFVVALGTSLPEIATSLVAAFQGFADVPISQVIGSNIANTFLILGVIALVAGSLRIQRNLIDQELPILAAVTALFLLMVYDGVVGRVEGFILLVGFVVYMMYIFISEENRHYPASPEGIVSSLRELPAALFIFVLASIGLGLASWIVVDSLSGVASLLNVEEGVVALTILAFGTSLPEVVVSVRAVLKSDLEVAVGNLIGSSVLNILFVVGLPALLFAPLVTLVEGNLFHLLVLCISTILFVVSGISNTLSRWEGTFFVLIYVVFILFVAGIL